MERLVLLILKLLLRLSWVVLKFALRLVLFAWSGDWRKLDKLEAQLRELLAEARRGEAPAPAQKSPRASAKSVRAPRSKTAQQWPFEFAPELTDAEPEGELQGGEALVPNAAANKRAFKRRAPPRPEQPLALALRDPRVVRDAMVLTAVLGPRDRRARRFG